VASIALGPVSLTVGNLDRSLAFWRDAVGLVETGGGDGRAALGDVLELVEAPGAPPAPRRSTGLYHVALLHPIRSALAATLASVARAGYRFSGASDHLVSEAVYLADPDGHGVELYVDRPRDTWHWRDGTVAMETLPLDLDDLLSTRRDDEPPGQAAIGHVHLKVDDLARAEAFYAGLGFDLVARYPGAAFMSRDGYHHHFGMNVWESAGAPPAPAGTAAMRAVTMHLDGVEPGQQVDPAGNVLVFR
jgi:catechol 2,3-dioxygenase